MKNDPFLFFDLKNRSRSPFPHAVDLGTVRLTGSLHGGMLKTELWIVSIRSTTV